LTRIKSSAVSFIFKAARLGEGNLAQEAPMKATIWHNPACGTSRKTLAILAEVPEIDLTVVEYLANPPSVQKLVQLYRDAGITPQQGLRLRGTDAEDCRRRAIRSFWRQWQPNRS
jgi:hypothetical protein